MRKKVLYYLFSILIVLSGTFAVAPMAFCTMDPVASHSDCCAPPSTHRSKSNCPICAYDQSKINPSPATISTKSLKYFQRIVTIPYSFSFALDDHIVRENYITIYNDTSPIQTKGYTILRL